MNAIAVGDVVDVVDVIASVQPQAVANGSVTDTILTAYDSVADDVQLQVSDLTVHLQGLLGALAGTGDCADNVPEFGTNPLANTPFAEYGERLSLALNAAQAALNGNGDPDLQALSDVVSALADELNAAPIPGAATDAPILGGALGLVTQAVNDLDATLAEAAEYDGIQTGLRAADTVENLINNLLLNVVPVAELENRTGTDEISSQVEAVAAQIRDSLAPALTAGAGGVVNVLDVYGQPLLNEFELRVLTPLLAPLAAALDAGLPSSPLPTGGITVPDAFAGALDEIVSGLLGNQGIANLLSGVVGGTCLAEGTPLETLVCGVLLSGT